MATSQDHLDRSQRLKILRWISGEPYIQHHKSALEGVLPGTGQWLLRHPTFLDWKNQSASSILWLHGIPGSGKSKLISMVVEDAIQGHKQQRAPAPAYFYCHRSQQEPGRADPAHIISCLVKQLAKPTPEGLLDPIIKAYEDREDNSFAAGPLSLDQGNNLMLDLLWAREYQDRGVIIILDALDECSRDNRDGLLVALESLLEHSPCLVKIFVSSRDDQDIVCKLRTYPTINLSSSENTGDIDTYIEKTVRDRIESGRLLQGSSIKQELQSKIIETLQEKAQGMFRWASLQVDMLCQQTSDDAVEERLGRLPKKLENAYEEIFDSICNYEALADRQATRNALSWLLCSPRAPNMETFLHVVRYTQGAIMSPISQEQILRLCCNLVVYDVNLGIFRFSHLSVREFLEVPRVFSNFSNQPRLPWTNYMSWKDANITCAAICLEVITEPVSVEMVTEIIDLLPGTIAAMEKLGKFCSGRLLYFFASLNWYDHIANAGESSHHLLLAPNYGKILDISCPEFWVWFLIVATRVRNNGLSAGSTGYEKKCPVSALWQSKASGDGKYGEFLRDECINSLFRMDNKVHALLCQDPFPTEHASASETDCRWRASGGFDLVDRFHLTQNEYPCTSFVQRVNATEKGDTERASFLGNMPLNIWIWTSMLSGAHHTFKKELSDTADISWLHDVPEHLVQRFSNTKVWEQKKSGHTLVFGCGESERRNGKGVWKSLYPPSFFLMLGAGLSDSSSAVFGYLADWLIKQPSKADYAQKVWAAGGFLIPSLSKRLVLECDVSIDCRFWEAQGTALHYASSFWVHDAIKTLLDLGADGSVCTTQGWNALHCLSYQDRLSWRSRHPRSGTVKQTALKHLYRKSSLVSSVNAIVKSVPDQEALLDQPYGMKSLQPLICAVRSSRKSATLVKAILDQGANANQWDHRGRTGLMWFFDKNFLGKPAKILSLLLAAGADVKASDAAGRSVMDYYARVVMRAELSNFYAGFNSYNRTFHVLSTQSSLSENEMGAELRRLKIPLVAAARLGNSQMTSLLLRAGADANMHGMIIPSHLSRNSGSESMELEEVEWNPLMVALRGGAFVTAALLILHGGDVRVHSRKMKRTKSNKYKVKQSGRTTLHVAIGRSRANYGVQDLCSTIRLTNNDCWFLPVDQANSERRKWSMSHLCRCENQRGKNEESSDSEYESAHRTVFANESRGADLLPYDTAIAIDDNLSITKEEQTFFEKITDKTMAFEKRQEAMLGLLIYKGADPNACTGDNVTVLNSCTRKGLLGIAKILLENGADPNVADKSGGTPLMIAAKEGNNDMVQLLLTSGAHPDAQLISNPPDKCACVEFLHWGSFTHSHCNAPLTALALAVIHEHGRVVELLLDHGADPNLEIVHHAHGHLPTEKDRRRRKLLNWESSDDSDAGEDRVSRHGHIAVATALTWARGAMRDTLLAHGADPARVKTKKDCDCKIEPGKRNRYPRSDSSDDEYPSRDSSTERTWESMGDVSDDEDDGFFSDTDSPTDNDSE